MCRGHIRLIRISAVAGRVGVVAARREMFSCLATIPPPQTELHVEEVAGHWTETVGPDKRVYETRTKATRRKSLRARGICVSEE